MDTLFEKFKGNNIVVVGNKPPMTPRIREGKKVLERSVGGLTCALEPLVRQLKGQWYCTIPKSKIERFKPLKELPYNVHTLELTADEIDKFYEGYSNNQLWPICHYFSSHLIVNEGDFETYRLVNEKMADLIVENVSDSDFIWVNDYHFFLLPSLLKKKNPNLKIGFFLHIPFPSQEVFSILPKRNELLHGLLGADLIGFHTKQYVDNFIDCIEKLVPDVLIDFKMKTLSFEDRDISISDFPISIDYSFFSQRAASKEVVKLAADLRAAYHSDLIGISIDRLDYSKGPLDRLHAIEKFFDNYPEYIGKITFIQIAVPSREKIETYQHLKQHVDEMTGRLSGKFSKAGWSPVHYLYKTLPTDELIAYYLITDVALVLPLRDGMNIVAKEYVASKTDHNGVLILSEFTGAADELTSALLVNPYDQALVSDAIKEAIEMSKKEKQVRMEKLQKVVREHDLYHWVELYLQALFDAAN